MLAASRLPLIAGCGTDIAGARAALALAARLGGVFDHMHSDALLRDLDVMREAGVMLTTLGQVRTHADVVLLVGPAATAAWPQLLGFRGEHPAERRVLALCPGRGVPIPNGVARTVGRDPREIPILLAALRSRLAGRPVSKIPGRNLDAVAAALKQARFGVAIWSAAELDALTIEMLCGLVADLNAGMRFSGLPLGLSDNALGVAQACGWITGFPVRVGFGRSPPEHDPWRFDAGRLVQSGEADCVVWISAYRMMIPPWTRDVPTVALVGREEIPFRERPRVHIAVGRPGVDHASVEHVPDFGTLAMVSAAQPSRALSVADVIGRLMAALPSAR